MKKRLIAVASAFLLCFALSKGAQATTIEYATQNISGSTWEYKYLVSDYVFNQNSGFTLYFDYNLFENIQPISTSPAWDTWIDQPVPAFSMNGVYDNLALVDAASTAKPFVVQVDWLGLNTPGAQEFEIYSDSGLGFNILETGATIPVPEPVTLLLFGLGGVMGIASRKRS